MQIKATFTTTLTFIYMTVARQRLLPPSRVCERTSTGTHQFAKPMNNSELSIEVKGYDISIWAQATGNAGVGNKGRLGYARR
jgi:hypothetical protein